jgi:hypothetical protein
VKKIHHIRDLDQLLICNLTGLIITNSIPKKFRTDFFIFTKYKRDLVINLCPSIPVNYEEERSVMSTLILHVPFPFGGEKNILLNNQSVFDVYQSLEKENKIPEYVKIFHNRVKESETLLSINEDNNINLSNTNDNILLDERNNLQINIDENDINDINEDNINNIIDDNENENGNNIKKLFYESNTNLNDFINIHNNNTKQKFNNYIIDCKTKAIKYRIKEVQIPKNEITKISKMKLYREDMSKLFKNIYPVENEKLRFDKLNAKYNEFIENTNCKMQVDIINIYKKKLSHYPFDSEYKKEKQIIGFISGQGGTGKSEIIKFLTEWTNVSFGKTEGEYGQTLNTGPTGYAGDKKLITYL